MDIRRSVGMSNELELQTRIYVAGHRGLVGSALVRALLERGSMPPITRSHAALDLTNQSATESFFDEEQPDVVILAAALVGGIHANNVRPAEFIQDNLAIQTNVINASVSERREKTTVSRLELYLPAGLSTAD